MPCAIFYGAQSRRGRWPTAASGSLTSPFSASRPGPLPAGAASEAERAAVLPPAVFAPRQLARLDPRNPQRRSRRRERFAVAGAGRPGGEGGLAAVGLEGRGPPRVSPKRVIVGVAVAGQRPALAKRLATLPARALAQGFTEVRARGQTQPPPQFPHRESWTEGRARCARRALVKGATRAAMRTTPQALQTQPGLVLAGRRRVRGAALTQRPLWQLDTAAAAAHDQRFAPELLAAVPAGGVLRFALGVCRLLWVADCTEQHQ